MMMKSVSRVAIAALLVAAGAVAQTRQPLTHELMFLMKRVGTPSVSPDGKWVVFPVTEPAYDEKDQSSDLWVVPADGSAKPRRLTFNKPSENDLAWAGDSRRIAFSAKREGDDANQIYILDVGNGGEARRVTNVSTGARTPRFSPDGNSIAFTSVVYPGAADDEANKKAMKEEKDRKYKVRVFDSFPVRNWDRWLDEKRPHLLVQSLEEGSAPKDLLAGTQLALSPGFSGQTAEGSSREDISATWSPDGTSIVFAVATTRNEAAFAEFDTDLYRASTTGGEPQRIAVGSGGTYGDPTFSPDGKTLFAILNPNNGKLHNLNRVVAFDWPSMTNRRFVVGPPFDRSVGDFGISADSKTFYFLAEDEAADKLFAVPTAGGEPKLVIAPERGTYSDLAVADEAKTPTLIARWGSSVNPNEVIRFDLTTKKHRNLTEFNVEQAAQIDWQPPRHFWFTASNGRRIHSMLFLPPNFDETKKYPLLVFMHGGPHMASKDTISLRWNYHLLSKPGYVLVTTNFSGSTSFGEKFAQDIIGDPLKGPAQEINEAADEAIKRFPFIDGTRQAAAGASYGGHLANWLEGTTNRYKAIISHAGLATLESQWGSSDSIFHRELMAGGPPWAGGPIWREQSPLNKAANFKTPILISVGERDYRVPVGGALEMWSAVQRMKVPSRLLVWPEENHWILSGENSRVFYREVHNWLQRWVK